MAILNAEVVEFDKEDLEAAWENAPSLINKDKDEFRMCYICKFHMDKSKFDNDNLGEFGWIVDLIDVKNFSLDQDNFIAIHPRCITFKPKPNNKSLVKKVKKKLWAFDENAYSQ
ncbi:hypothetical protein SHELI_v1c02070 [Spiroplasma helicoides]|uniref:Uncharacterized protein n=1 Tax=Spiroplasma helicoides TaxID=216938 RepID=A0A1B3SJQ7_9MOLU|nr:hypothetical protein [Spiroplasma helicoides]AOG60162.1 hypothetical protein SHELI_v1c02070 [Spiroplasma helicoides]